MYTTKFTDRVRHALAFGLTLPLISGGDGSTESATVGRGTKMAELTQRMEELEGEILGLAETEVLDRDQEDRWLELITERDAIKPELDKLEERAKKVDEINSSVHRQIHGAPQVRKPIEELFGKDVTRMDWREARDGALRIVDDKDQSRVLRSTQLDELDRQVRSAAHTDIARRIIVTENDHYRSAFHKLVTDDKAAAYLSPEESEAMRAYFAYRAAAEGTTTTGGFAIPVFIDPSIIITDQESGNPFLTIARQVDVNTSAWKGVSAAGMTWSFDAEAAEVSDDSLTIAQPSVTVFTARGLIPFSLEIGQDWPGFQSEMARVCATGYDELLIDKFSRGSGTGEPRGLLTALAASSPTVIVTSTTDGAFGQEDVYAAWKSLPLKYRRNASWMMNVGIMNKIRQMGTSNVYHASTVNLMAGAIDKLFERPVYESPYFPDFSATTGASNRLVVGDFSNYVIAKRSGMTVELVPHLLATANNLPSGQRAWFAWARIGGNSVNDKAFALLANT